ncbi:MULTISPECIES: hypothetical protein [Sphingomonas]|uniref:DUF4129 domain-containing protein n=1 Tax=Sphingomonas leidyi TaxID=68569 RepID=A0A7X5ZUZ3_9SPHN|nr:MULTISPECIES: hypothetical protein [unclassified Sphingomonas]MBN8811304.1 hypothetical protein [Sphingomonas sp.]NIJ64184.1 hypothetical protein [Sphingomonas leidyi]OJY53229.1 MAG: hypothetical protein BGP17_11035 [Sphingomonas sp. 67-41]
MTVQGSTAQSVARAHEALRARSDIQFEMSAAKPPEIPPWMRWLARQLGEVAPYMGWVLLACVVIGAAIILYLVVSSLIRARPSGDAEAMATRDVAAWRPSEKAARALLADAEALAAQGRYEEAVHLLLQRSLEDIQRHRPRLLRPALTSREIAGSEWMPGIVRRAFAAMARPVERSLFGGRSLARADWEEARAAYGEFALPGAWR